MNTDQHIRAWMLYRAYRRWCGIARGHMVTAAGRRWVAAHPEPSAGYICWLCGSPIQGKGDSPQSFSIDHIIPQDLVLEYQLHVALIWDARNLRPAHKYCNNRRGNTHPTYADLSRAGVRDGWMLRQFQALRRSPVVVTPGSDTAKWLERAGYGSLD